MRSAALSKQPLTFYRLWCGRKRYSPWLPSRRAAFQAGIRHGVTFEDKLQGGLFAGPLTWIEVGQRRYAKSKTVSLGRG